MPLRLADNYQKNGLLLSLYQRRHMRGSRGQRCLAGTRSVGEAKPGSARGQIYYPGDDPRCAALLAALWVTFLLMRPAVRDLEEKRTLIEAL